MAQGDHTQEDPNPLATDEDLWLAEVRLHLVARRGLEAHGGHGAGMQLTPQRRDRPLDGAQ